MKSKARNGTRLPRNLYRILPALKRSPLLRASNSAEAAPLACVGVGLVQEVRARVHVGERPDAQAVDGMKLGFQKLTARLLHVL